MSLYLPEHNSLFVHIPKCAGNWVKAALEVLGVKYAYATACQPVTGHVPPWACSDPFEPNKSFVFIRHPLTWYESWWKFQAGKWLDFEVGLWHPQRCLQECASDYFSAFVCKVGKQYPGYVTRLYDWYLGPEGFDYVGMVGTVENLTLDFITIMMKLGIGVDPKQREALTTLGKVNESEARKGQASWFDRENQFIAALEVAAIGRWGKARVI